PLAIGMPRCGVRFMVDIICGALPRTAQRAVPTHVERESYDQDHLLRRRRDLDPSAEKRRAPLCVCRRAPWAAARGCGTRARIQQLLETNAGPSRDRRTTRR